MSRQFLYREATFTESDSDGRTIHGIAVPYEQIAEIREYDYETGKPRVFREQFVRGAFARSIEQRAHRVLLMIQHDRRKLAAGKATRLHEEDDGLHAEFRVSDTRDGNELLTLVRDGVIQSFSIGFRIIREHWKNDLRTVTEAMLGEVSAVNFPAYQGAVIGGIRTQSLVIPRSVAMARLKLLDL